MKTLSKLTVAIAITLLFAAAASAQPASSYDTTFATAKPTSGYDGGFFIQSDDGKYKLTLGTRLDTMFYWQSNDADTDDPTTLTLDESADHLTFRIRRGSISLNPVFNEKLSFLFALTASTGDSGFSTTYLLNGNYDFNPYIGVQFGMIDCNYDLQNIFSTKKYTMVDFPIIMTQKDGERPVWSDTPEAKTVARPSMGLPQQLGIMLYGKYFNDRFNWSASFGNGSEETDSFNRNKRFLYALRLSYDILGSSPYGAMNDYSYSETPSLAVGAGGAFEHDNALRNSTGAVMYNWSLDGTADVAFRYRGFAFNGGGYYRQIKVGPAAVFEAGEKYLTDVGYLADASMFAIPKKLEFQGWASQIVREGPDNDVYEFGGGLNYYFAGPNAKFGVDYSRVVDYDSIAGTDKGHTNRIRAKMQLYF